MQIDSIKVQMLGGFSVLVNGQIIVGESAKLTKPWQLFCYLLLHREKFVTNRKLISMLWADDMLTDPANVLKNAVYSLRKELCGGESFTDSPIIYSTGGYRFDPAINLEIDVDNFMQLSNLSCSTTETGDEKMKLCRNAIDSYSGEFLPQLDQDLWIVPLALDYRRKYFECAHELYELLWQRRQHKELMHSASKGIEYDVLDEKAVVYLFRALDALRMYRVIVTTYSRISQVYSDALGGEPPTEAQKIYNAASERINKTEQDIIIIKTELTGATQASRPQRGAFYCSYSNLKHMYQILKRAAERSDRILVLALFTLLPGKGVNPTQYDLTRAMAEFKVVAMNSLRKADAISRYSRNQYTMLLSVTSLEDGRLVRDRIRESFSHASASRKMAMDVKLTEV